MPEFRGLLLAVRPLLEYVHTALVKLTKTLIYKSWECKRLAYGSAECAMFVPKSAGMLRVIKTEQI